MRKANIAGGEIQGMMLPSYEKKKLLGYAESFRDLAKTFTYKGTAGEAAGQDRQTRLMKRRLLENREILADNLNEVARIIRSVAEESCCLYPFGEKEMKRIIRICRENGILIQSIYHTEDEIYGMRLAVSMCADERHVLTAEDAAELLSRLLGRRLLPERDSLFFLTKDYETILFEQAAPYSVLTGAAMATRENEAVSGDTYSFIERGNGSLLMALSDGMGSGEKAMADSETVIELLEKLIEAGFSKEAAAEMINGALIARFEEANMSTLDVCDINLYTGGCEMMKIGSSYTYIKRGAAAEQVASDTLPLGIFHKMDAGRQDRQLQDGDYVIMVSDGIVDGAGDDELLREIIAQNNMRNPQEMANYILQFVLHRSAGRIQDDMTVLVLGIWQDIAF